MTARPPLGRDLRVTRVVHAPPERIFAMWTEAEHLLRWWGRPGGASVPAVEIDLRVGGAYRITMRTPTGHTMAIVGTYQVIEPPHRLVYTMAWEPKSRHVASTVSVELREHNGGTEVVVVQTGLRGWPTRTFHRVGWWDGLRRLARG